MRLLITLLIWLTLPLVSFAQDRHILVPDPLPGSPFNVADKDDLFGQSYRWFIEGDYQRGVDSLRQLITQAGIELDDDAYYIVVSNFTDSFSPIGILHGQDDFFSTRMFGLEEDNLFYIFVSRQREGKSFVSLMATAKNSPFVENLPLFIKRVPALPKFSLIKISSLVISTSAFCFC